MLRLAKCLALLLIIEWVSSAALNETRPTEELLITGIAFDCSNKPTGFYKDATYCDLFHVCVGFKQRKTYGCPQNGDQFFYDESLKMCEFASRNPTGCPSNTYYQQVQSSGITDLPNSQTSEPDEPWKQYVRQSESFSCLDKNDGFYASRWCNVFYRCSNGAKFEFLCAKQTSGERLWWSGHSQPQQLSQESAQCAFPCESKRACSSPGGLLVEDGNLITESVNEPARVLNACSGSGKDPLAVDHSSDLFRLPQADTNEQVCAGKADGSFQGDDKYCNVFHVCFAGTRRDFLCAKATNGDYELWWDDVAKRCDWPCKVNCTQQIFGGVKTAVDIKAVDRLVNSADCPTPGEKAYNYRYRAFRK